MRNFSWNVFTMTGDVDAYLLYKETEDRGEEEDVLDHAEDEQEI